MITKGKHLLALVVTSMAVAAGNSASAEVLQYRFIDQAGTEITKVATASYLNAKSSVTVMISAGLDRKVRISLMKGPTVSSTAVSEKIGPSNQILIDGKKYYGVALPINTPVDGEYELVAETLTSSEEVVSTERLPITFDTVAPVVGNWTWKFPYGGGTAPDGLPILSIVEAWHLSLGVNDIGDVAKAFYRTFEQTDDGKKLEVLQGSLTIATDTKTIMMGTGLRNSVTAKMIPQGKQGKYSVEFIAQDKAGNESSQELEFWNNGKCGEAPIQVAIQDNTYSGLGFMGVPGFRPLDSVSSTPVTENPARVMYKLPNKEVKATQEGAIFGGQPANVNEYTIVKSEGGYTYFIVKEVINVDGNMNWSQVGWTNYSTWRCSPFTVNDPKFSSSALPPTHIKSEAYIEGYGWLPTNPSLTPNSVPNVAIGRDVTISKVRGTVQSRPYPQIIDFGNSYGTSVGSCEVPPGADSCVSTKEHPFNTANTVGMIVTAPAVYSKNEPGLKVKSPITLRWHWDAQDPVVDKLDQHDPLEKNVVFSATEKNSGANEGAVKMWRGGLVARNASGVEHQIIGSMESFNGSSRFTTSYRSLKSGYWDIYGWAQDGYGNKGELKLFTIDNDGEAPLISIETSGSSVSSLDQLSIKVADDKTERPKILEIKLEGGPAKNTVYLTAIEKSKNEYKLEYPVIFPSSGNNYKLSVSAQDDVGNISTNTLTFLYEPPMIGLEKDGFSIPSIGKYSWVHANGKLPFTSKELTNYEGMPLTGSYDLSATLSADSTAGPITINSITIRPGETKNIGNFDFTKSRGRLSLPLFAENIGAEGTANILVSSGAPGAPIVVSKFQVWSPKISVNPNTTSLDGLALVDALQIGLTDLTGRCNWRPKSEIGEINTDIVDAPSCYNIAFENGLEFYGGKDYSTLSTRMTASTRINVPANSKGAKIKGSYLKPSGEISEAIIELPVQSSGIALVSRDPSNVIKFGSDDTQISVYRSIQPIDQRLSQTSGPTCASVTSREADAIASGSKMNLQKGIASISCYFKWTATPPGLVVGDNEQQSFKVNGTIDQLGTFPLAWELIAYTPLGADYPVTLSRQETSVEVIDPPAPSIEIQSKRSVFDNLYAVQKKPTNIGVVNITGQADGAVIYKVMRAGAVIADSSDKSAYARKTATFRLNSDSQDKLWASQSYTLQTSYVKLPDIIASKEIRTVTVPDDDMSMKVTSDTVKALSTDTVPVTISFYNKSSAAEKYSVKEAGQWAVRLVDVKSAKNRQALSSWVNVNADGTATIDLPLSLNAGEVMRVGSEGTLKSELEGFEMSKLSANTLNLTVLDASPVAGSLKSHRVSGIAPLSVGTSIVSNQKDLISEVLWEISSDQGKSWSSIDGAPTSASKMLSHTYDAGTYSIRAKLTNKNSQATSYSSTLEIQAYHIPNARLIDGPSVLLPGQKAEKHVTDKDGAVLSDDDGIVFEWSTDRGETWINTKNKFLFENSKEIGNYPLWSRIRYASSPADDSYAYKIVKTMVSVRKTAKVTVSLVGTTQPEVNKPNHYTSTVKLPYSNMEGQLAGRFTLPDGSKVDGFSLDYRPTEVANANQTITFEAWIEGYENDSKRSVSKKLRTWEYNWPVFNLRKIINPSTYAPMSLDLRVENVGSLSRIEGLTYAWDLPQSEAFLLASSQSGTRRNVSITEPGEYPVSVTISDDRGNVTTLEDTLVITEAPPWIIDMTWTGSNPSNRAVLDVRTKPQITRGHKYDNITGYSYKVNGAPVGSSNRYTSFSLTEPGRYELSLDLTTELGFGGHGSTIIEVQENKKPVCSLDVKQTSTAYVVTSKCSDPDGKMASYEWLVNGETQSLKGSSISISKRTYPSQPSIQLTGIDDSGGRSEQVVW